MKASFPPVPRQRTSAHSQTACAVSAVPAEKLPKIAHQTPTQRKAAAMLYLGRCIFVQHFEAENQP